MGKEKKLKLNYIIIGRLDKSQKEYLQQNFHKNEPEEKGVRVIWLDETTVPCTEICHKNNILPEHGIMISENKEQLYDASKIGIATLGYLARKKCAREQYVESVDKTVDNTFNMCSDVNGHDTEMDVIDSVNVDMWAEGFEEIGLDFLTHVYERHHGLPWTILETERCVVKEFSMEYLDDLFELYSGEGMTDYMEPLYSYEEERAYQEAYIKHMYGFYGYGMWIVCDRMTGKLIGRAGVEHREELDGEMELGYAIGVPYQRQGYATEVCRAILTYVREVLLQESICCMIEEGNEVSECFAKKLDFHFDKTVILGEKSMKKYIYQF